MPPSSRPRSSRPRPRSAPLHVWKFGGASLADATAVATAARRIADYRGPLVVVASALAGITDVLLDAADHAVAGRAKAAATAVATLRQRHERVATALLPRGPAPPGRARGRRRLGRRVRGDPRRRRHPAAPVAAHPRPHRRPGRTAVGHPAGRGRHPRRPPGRLRGRPRGRGHRRPPRRRQPADRADHSPGDQAAAPAPGRRTGADRAGLHRPRPRRQRRHARPRRLRPHRHPAGAGARRRGRVAVEGRPRHPDVRPAAGARRAADPATASPGGR